MTALTVTQKSSPSIADERTEHFVVTSDGKGYISQKAMATLCGVNQPAISKWINRAKQSGIPLDLNEINQLGESSIVEGISYYADQGNEQAIKSAVAMMRAGVRAYIYAKAGYVLVAEPQNQISFSTSDLCLSVRDMAEVYNTSYDSMNATFSRERKRLLYEFPELAQQCVLADGRWRFTPAFALLVHRTGKAATLARGKQLLEKVEGQKLLA